MPGVIDSDLDIRLGLVISAGDTVCLVLPNTCLVIHEYTIKTQVELLVDK